MIPESSIIQWREVAPWPNDAQVEQDLIISRALVEIFNHEFLKGKVAFSPHFSQSFVARPFKRRPIRSRGLKGVAGILDSMSKSLEGARPYRVDGWAVAVESL